MTTNWYYNGWLEDRWYKFVEWQQTDIITVDRRTDGTEWLQTDIITVDRR